MTQNENSKLQELLEWVDFEKKDAQHKANKKRTQGTEYSRAYFTKSSVLEKIIEKIQSLMSEPASEGENNKPSYIFTDLSASDDKTVHHLWENIDHKWKLLNIPQVEPSEWQVGDRLVEDDICTEILRITEGKIYLLHDYYELKKDIKAINIDAELRAKDAEIAELKKNNERITRDRQHFEGLFDSKCEDIQECYDCIDELKSEIARLKNNDPWCYDMSKAPKDDTNVSLLTSYINIKTLEIKLETLKAKWDEDFNDYIIYPCESFFENFYNSKLFIGNIHAFRIIPEPKKGDKNDG